MKRKLTVFVGIDPGARGALVALDNHRTVISDLRFAAADPATQAQRLGRLASDHHVHGVAVEVVRSFGTGHQAPPGSLVKMGAARGFWEGVCAAYGVRLFDVQPKEWQKALVLPKGLPRARRSAAIKRAAVALAKARHPGLIGGRCEAENPLADAALMADWLRARWGLLALQG